MAKTSAAFFGMPLDGRVGHQHAVLLGPIGAPALVFFHKARRCPRQTGRAGAGKAIQGGAAAPGTGRGCRRCWCSSGARRPASRGQSPPRRQRGSRLPPEGAVRRPRRRARAVSFVPGDHHLGPMNHGRRESAGVTSVTRLPLSLTACRRSRRAIPQRTARPSASPRR